MGGAAGLQWGRPLLKAREAWIGWSPRQRARRLGLVVNNSRFLFLVERERHPNLASKVLALALRRLSGDWEGRWGHPVLVVESFADETRYRGTSYRACGFEAAGATAGFSLTARDWYTEHGQPKALYLRELCKDARKLLRRPRLPADLREFEAKLAGPCPLRAPALESLYKGFLTLRDPRKGHGLHHRLAGTMACAALATLMGAGSYQGYEDVCKKLTQRQLRALGCHRDPKTRRHVAPSDSTFHRVMNLVDPVQFEAIMAAWLLQQDLSRIQRLAVDGKVLRGSARGGGKPLALLSAVSHRVRVTVRSEPIAEKSNEIPAIKPLLAGMDLQGVTVTADAMHCQQESARYITRDLGVDHIFGLKGNQSGILERAERKLAGVIFPSGP